MEKLACKKDDKKEENECDKYTGGVYKKDSFVYKSKFLV